MEDQLRELCGLCRSPVNPGAVVCASCGAYKQTDRGSMGCLVVAIGALVLVLPAALAGVLLLISAIFGSEGFGGEVIPLTLVYLGIGWLAFRTARKHLWRRKNPQVLWVKRT